MPAPSPHYPFLAPSLSIGTASLLLLAVLSPTMMHHNTAYAISVAALMSASAAGTLLCTLRRGEKRIFRICSAIAATIILSVGIIVGLGQLSSTSAVASIALNSVSIAMPIAVAIAFLSGFAQLSWHTSIITVFISLGPFMIAALVIRQASNTNNLLIILLSLATLLSCVLALRAFRRLSQRRLARLFAYCALLLKTIVIVLFLSISFAPLYLWPDFLKLEIINWLLLSSIMSSVLASITAYDALPTANADLNVENYLPHSAKQEYQSPAPMHQQVNQAA
ncbi:hypothetical protein ACFLIN_01625 [Corynebacterium kutscheri]|uniref:hypothetical protein n=1 Tax=Corynebacterium kutscheri TaxID=35755 RepID=UPI0037BF87D2